MTDDLVSKIEELERELEIRGGVLELHRIRVAELEDAERQRDELLAAASTFICEWDNCKSSGEWPVRQLGVLRAAIQAAKEQGK